jgi:hypothetical protein
MGSIWSWGVHFLYIYDRFWHAGCTVLATAMRTARCRFATPRAAWSGCLDNMRRLGKRALLAADLDSLKAKPATPAAGPRLNSPLPVGRPAASGKPAPVG